MCESVVNLQFENPLCCHAVFQVIDEVLMFVLYETGQVPEHVPKLLSHYGSASHVPEDSPSFSRGLYKRNLVSQRTKKFVNDFLLLRNSLRSCFRTHNAKQAKEIFIGFGGSQFTLVSAVHIILPEILQIDDFDHEPMSNGKLQQVAAKLFAAFSMTNRLHSGATRIHVFIACWKDETDVNLPGFLSMSGYDPFRRKIRSISTIVLSSYVQNSALAPEATIVQSLVSAIDDNHCNHNSQSESQNEAVENLAVNDEPLETMSQLSYRLSDLQIEKKKPALSWYSYEHFLEGIKQ